MQAISFTKGLSEVASSEETTFPGSEGTEEYKFVIPILVRIKRLLERAAPRHAALSEPDRLMAIICLDWSVETLIKTIALVCDKSYFKDKKRIRDLSFPKVWSDVNGFLVTRCGAVNVNGHLRIPFFGHEKSPRKGRRVYEQELCISSCLLYASLSWCMLRYGYSSFHSRRLRWSMPSPVVQGDGVFGSCHL